MEEMQKLEEEERKQDAIEEVLTVTKQKDMSGFYRHLYRQTMGEEKGQKEVPVVKVEPVSVDAAKTEVEAVGVKTEIEEDLKIFYTENTVGFKKKNLPIYLP